MGFQHGLSGLNLSSKALDTVGNNVANSQTVGFKAGSTQFNDVYAAAMSNAASSNSIGQGGGVMSVAQLFTQGNITTTNNPLDVAINGNGFLHFQPSLSDETPQYSRNGQLHLNAEGYVVNAQDMYLNAYPSSDGESIDQSQAAPLQISSAQMSPRATGASNITTPGSGGIEIGLNLDVRDKKADLSATGLTAATGWTSLETWNFATLNPNMYNYSTTATVYDQRGESHVLSMYFARQGMDDGTGTGVGGSSWTPHFVLDNQYEIINTTNNGAAPTYPSTLDFNSNGQLNTNNNGSLFTLDVVTYGSVIDAAGVPVDLVGAPRQYFPDPAISPTYALTIDFESASQFGSKFDVNRLTQDGYAAGRVSGLSIDKEGMVSARYSNGQTKMMGQVALTIFQNSNGLIPLGNNMWAESVASGQPMEGVPNSGSRGLIQAGAVEDANVDLTLELVNMITLQRAYQANAQTIRTHDQLLQTLVNLR